MAKYKPKTLYFKIKIAQSYFILIQHRKSAFHNFSQIFEKVREYRVLWNIMAVL